MKPEHVSVNIDDLIRCGILIEPDFAKEPWISGIKVAAQDLAEEIDRRCVEEVLKALEP